MPNRRTTEEKDRINAERGREGRRRKADLPKRRKSVRAQVVSRTRRNRQPA